MRRNTILSMCLVVAPIWSLAAASPICVTLERPAGNLTMGDTPSFAGRVANTGSQPLKGLIVYLSLVSLQPGNEHPVDLEDWSADRAMRIARLGPGQSNKQKWTMRLIAAGRFGVALTVVDPSEERPIVSKLVQFQIRRKPMLSLRRILPVAVGEPVVLLVLYVLVLWRIKQRRLKRL